MSTKCDSCKETVNEDDGSANVGIRDPAPDFNPDANGLYSTPNIRRVPTVDLCARCLVKMIEVLGLPKDTFTPRTAKKPPDSPTGGLTPEDLIALGLVDKP